MVIISDSIQFTVSLTSHWSASPARVQLHQTLAFNSGFHFSVNCISNTNGYLENSIIIYELLFKK